MVLGQLLVVLFYNILINYNMEVDFRDILTEDVDGEKTLHITESNKVSIF